eukprot:6992937-Prymnesium_polylepis.1
MVEFNLFNTTILYHSANGATRETADTTLRRGGRCSTHGESAERGRDGDARVVFVTRRNRARDAPQVCAAGVAVEVDVMARFLGEAG